MATTSPNFGFPMNDDDQERFIDWRKKVNTGEESAVYMIDKEIAKKNDKIKVMAGELKPDGWDPETKTQTLTFDGLTEDSNGEIGIALGATTEQREFARKAKFAVAGQSENQLTIMADGQIPTVSVPVVLAIFN